MSMLGEQFVVDAKDKKAGVILSLKTYQKPMEDLHNLAAVAERRSEELIPFDEMKRWLRNGFQESKKDKN